MGGMNENDSMISINAFFQPNYSEALAQETFPVIHPTQCTKFRNNNNHYFRITTVTVAPM